MNSKSPPQDRPNPFAGRTIARVQVGERIGSGRTSNVFKGHYEPLGRDIAIKILANTYAEHADMRETFLLEARAIARLDHENIVKVLDVVKDQDCLCILMEYVPGETLQELVARDGALPPAKALRIAREMAGALAAAHEEQIVHRDVKPANVILTGGEGSVKMVDFGLAGRKELANRAGTPLYMSPEACQGKRIDEKSDVYALGICLYQMLTGELPYTGKSVKAILAAHVKGDLTPASAVRPALGSTYDDLLKKLLVPSKGYRPTAAEAAEALDTLVEASRPTKSAGGRKGGRGGRRTASSRRTPTTTSGGNAGVIAGVVGLVVVGVVAAIILSSKDDEPVAETPTTEQPTTTPETGGGGALSAGNGTAGTTDPATPSPAETAAQAALAAAVTEAGKYPDSPDKRMELFKAVVLEHKGTEAAKQAGEKYRAAKQESEERAAAEEQARDAEREKQKAERLAKATDERDRIRTALDVFDFEAAAATAKHHGGLPGENPVAWRKELRRIEFLADVFVTRVDDAIRAQPGRSARDWHASAPPEAELVGADSSGLNYTWDGGEGSISWSEFKDSKKDLFHRIRKSLSSSDPEQQLFVAILAAQVFHDDGGPDNRQSKNAREVIDLVDETGRFRGELSDFFLEP